MLKPFQIRGLHISPSQVSEEAPTSTSHLSEKLQSRHDINVLDSQSSAQQDRQSQLRSHGIVRLSATEYDDLASNHPRARLTYVDDDDGELIMVSYTTRATCIFGPDISNRLAHPLSFLNAWMNLSILPHSWISDHSLQVPHR